MIVHIQITEKPYKYSDCQPNEYDSHYGNGCQYVFELSVN